MPENTDIFEQRKKFDYKFFTNIGLFILTFFSTTIAGVGWLNQDPYQLENFFLGLKYSLLLLTMITAHEFGHYFAARIHKIDVTLPYYIPFPLLFLNPFGTMGAVIKIKERVRSKKALFDIGVAGPIAGWIVSIICLLIGYLTLPKIDYLFKIHPEYETSGIPVTGLAFGYNATIYFLNFIFGHFTNSFIPPMNEIYHYPFLCVGWFGLLITSLNMMPIGQLDGGHISYTTFGKKHRHLAHIIFILLVFFGLIGLLPYAGININIGSPNWLVWAVLIYFVIKIEHPPVIENEIENLGKGRIILGWFSYFIFLTSFCPIPISDGL
jgi:membrane-associated protease RseP (regulator of RpoE activity)